MFFRKINNQDPCHILSAISFRLLAFPWHYFYLVKRCICSLLCNNNREEITTTYPVQIYWFNFIDQFSKLEVKLSFSLKWAWIQWVKALCQATLFLKIKIELSPKAKCNKMSILQTVQNNSDGTIFKQFFLCEWKRKCLQWGRAIYSVNTKWK